RRLRYGLPAHHVPPHPDGTATDPVRSGISQAVSNKENSITTSSLFHREKRGGGNVFGRHQFSGLLY
ncbi:hypothetical protein, partial [Millionella massiliensis]|uniref:hypothetical protein n=1 Tax=Millionella massiliensis TaxID=1871023 RepID=UPI0023A8CEF2